MNRKNKFLIWFVILTIILSVTATFYKTVILQDFSVGGLGVYAEEDYTYTWFIYQDEEYEAEIDSNSFDELIMAVADEMSISLDLLDEDLIIDLQDAFEEAMLEI